MPDNLTINISANSDKARADLELLKAQLRATNKEVRDLANAGAKAGDVLPSAALQGASSRVQGLNRQIAALNKTFTQTGGVVDALATKSFRRLVTQFDSVGKSAQNIAMVMGGVTGSFAGGFLAASVFKAIGTLIEQLDAVRERITAIGAEAAKTGQKPIAVQAGQEIAQRQGQAADAATRFMAGVAEAAAKAQTDPAKEITGAVQVLRGNMAAAGEAARTMDSEIKNGVAALRGSSPLTMNLAEAYKMLGVSMKNVTGAGDSMLKKQLQVAEAFMKQKGAFNPLQLNELAKGLGFESSIQALKVLPPLIDGIRKKIEELNVAARGVSPERIAKQDELNAAKDRVNTWFDEIRASGEDWRTGVAITWNNALADFLTETLPAWGEGFRNFWPQLQADFAASWQTMLDNFRANGVASLADALTDWTSFFSSIQGLASSTLDWIWSKIQSVGSALSSMVSAAGAASPAIMPGFAGGGAVKGPGTATSDSILARLSAGEFVMRAAAVDHWGPRFMAALNSLQNPFGYAAGGLVRLPRFADGGLVAAGGGRPVHLHLGGNSFALSGSNSVVGALVTEAHAQQMRSAGVKPSWFAARPGGR